MIPDILVLERGCLTDYFSQLEDIINGEVAIPPSDGKNLFTEQRLHDLQVEVRKNNLEKFGK